MNGRGTKRFVGKRRRRPPNNRQQTTTTPPHSPTHSTKKAPISIPETPSTDHAICRWLGEALRLALKCLQQLIIEAFTYFKDDTTEQEQMVVIFPRFSIYLLMALTLWTRVSMVTNYEGHWILHPDEIFQSVEVAHSEAYGYGFRPYEFFAPLADDPGPNSNNESVYMNMGMYSMRSFLHPRLYQGIFLLREFFNWTPSPFQIAKLFHSIVASLLPFAIYKFALIVYGGRKDPALLSASLVAFSQPLMVLGTRTFVNSLLSPFLFICATAVVTASQREVTLNAAKECDSDDEAEDDDNDDDSGSDDEEDCEDYDFDLNDNQQKLFINNGHGGAIQLDVLDIRVRPGRRQRLLIARCTGICQLVISGLILGTSVYIRPDTLLILVGLVIVLVPLCPLRSCFVMVTLPVVLGFAAGMFGGGWSDCHNYGQWFISPKQWLLFQYQHAHVLFGSQDFFTYVREISSKSHSVFILLSTILITVAVQVTHRFISSCFLLNDFHTQNATELKNWRRLGFATFIILLFYSSHPHKELRFVHDFIVLFLVVGGGSLYMVFKTMYLFLVNLGDLGATKKRFIKLLLYGEVMLYIFAGRFSMPYASSPSTVRPWCYAGLAESGLVNQCLDYVSRQDDVSGVVVDYSIHMIGAYSVLHRDVPIIAKTHYEFREWEINDRLNLSATRVSVLDRVSNFITVENAGLLLKYVSQKPVYNYIITTGGRKLPKRGFRQVYNASDVRVYKKATSRLDKEALSQMAERLPLGVNATLLEYEGSWLVTLGLYPLAVERLREALRLEPERTRAWQLLSFAYSQLGNTTKAKETMQQCHAIHKGRECLLEATKVVLHPEYELMNNRPRS